MSEFDVIIVGAGPAGLSAALILGRCLRRVLVFDSGQYRNADALHVNGFLTQDGISPSQLRGLGRQQLKQYSSVEIRDVAVVDARQQAEGFAVITSNGEAYQSRRLLLATGLIDSYPEIPGFRELWGSSIFHCPYCDGWEMRGYPLAVYGRGKAGFELAMTLTQWSADLMLLTDGPADLDEEMAAELKGYDIAFIETRVVELRKRNGVLGSVVFDDGSLVSRAGLFVATDKKQRSPLAARLGVKIQEGEAATGHSGQTNIPGLYVAGDASRDVQMAIVAAAEGAQAAVAINNELIREDRSQRGRA